MIKYYFRSVKDESIETIDTLRAGTWIHAENAADEELADLVGECGLDEAILADARDFFEVPRFERSGNASYFFTRYPFDEKDEDIDTAPLLIVVGESYVLTVAQRPVPFLKTFRTSETEGVTTTQKAKLFLQIMDALTKAYEYELIHMRKAVQRDRGKLRDIRARDIERLVEFENTLNDTIAALVPTNTWLKQLATGSYLQFFTEDKDLMEDLMIANNQLIDSAKAILKTIQNIRSATEAILTQQLNRTIRTLTALTIILTIPTIIASLYGMNVPVPGGNNPQTFWVMLMVVAITILVMLLFFRSKRWF